MAHNVETMAYYGATPWHGLGKKVDHLMTAVEVIAEAGLDWTVSKEKVFALVDGKKVFIPGKYATIRNTDKRPLGVVGASYTPVQNAEATAFMDTLTGTGKAKYETAGSLQHGRIIWVMAKVPNGGGVDPIDQYLVFSTSHDATMPVQIKATPVRVVCNNTLNAALHGAGNVFRVRHTTNVADRMKEAERVFAGTLKYFGKTVEVFNKMKDAKVSDEKMVKIIEKVFALDNDDLSTRQENRLEKITTKIFELKETGAGTNLPGVKGTAWGAYNAITEYLDHFTTVKGGKGISAEEKLLTSTWFGTVSFKTQKAYNAVLEAVKIAA